jgi:hypothetical protein
MTVVKTGCRMPARNGALRYRGKDGVMKLKLICTRFQVRFLYDRDNREIRLGLRTSLP